MGRLLKNPHRMGRPVLVCCFALSLLVDADDGLSKWKRSDDNAIPQPVQALIDQQAAVIQQQAAMLQQQTADVQELQIRVASLENQVHTLQWKVAFTAYFTERGPLNIGQSAPIPFSHVALNTGNGYDPHTGIFTAPVSGDYLFLLHIKDDDAATTRNDLGIAKAGSMLAYVSVQGIENNLVNERSSISVTAHVNAGETVYATSEGPAIVDRWKETSFSGMLLFAD